MMMMMMMMMMVLFVVEQSSTMGNCFQHGEIHSSLRDDECIVTNEEYVCTKVRGGDVSVLFSPTSIVEPYHPEAATRKPWFNRWGKFKLWG